MLIAAKLTVDIVGTIVTLQAFVEVVGQISDEDLPSEEGLLTVPPFRAGANNFRLVRALHALKREQAREVWGHAPPGKFGKLGTLRSLLSPCLGQRSY